MAARRRATTEESPQLADAQRDVDPAAYDVFLAVLEPELDTDARVRAEELRKRGCDTQEAEGHRRGHPQAPPRLALVAADRGIHLGQLGERA